MEETHSRRKSWVELLEDETDTPSSIKIEPIDESKESETFLENEPKIEEVKEENVFDDTTKMDIDLNSIKSECPDSSHPVVSSDHAQSDTVYIKSEPVDDALLGSEPGWSKLVESASEEKVTPGKFTFAQICAKTSNSPSVAVTKEEPPSTDSESTSSSFTSPEKRGRKRSLFPDGLQTKESFGILDEKTMESPCKDIREIMTNIHMDSPLKQDENEDTSGVHRPSPWRKSLAKCGDLRDALRSPNKGDGSRKRTREHSKSTESPANKIAHVSTSPTNKTNSPKPRGKLQYEKDKETLSRRQKQIEYGKNTLGYQRYIQLVPREKREKRHPKTPPRHLRYSRRAWDGLVKVWRQKLHFWDPPKDGEETPTELPESWDNMSDDCSASMSDTTSERSIPSTPQSGRKSSRKCSQSDSECDTKTSVTTFRSNVDSVSA
ncbi:uncharacterized protein LOC117647066 [Thrips palmi]|uniref:Uncharacterized protein LOC117647066 n=1 Tax=Thrips palmi TaxID=161013 RepID=A0A6P8YWF7_THRPL|nr:uncharacterized protein LOC117647066 [Thrips palmi]XP_034244448.1 uncharacterized protein LOC117647066 [Thrips palmi]XP_034244449.1 uncharacterized protein LOC117647066 [Thrips palmi]XP_034244451.1 uncharacterized protein LOC117647066 [Thrips palmi]XP_034244452.1 uncharacterized protein LOC117647066 [Thrips palmi]XP_034244453.1 uncharacterized protein LOC117647066 [Thrips palmi]